MNKKKMIIAGAVLLAAIAMIVSVVAFVNYDRKTPKMTVDLYFLNAEETGIVAESHTIRYREDNDKILNALLKLQKAPSNSGLKRVIAKNTIINSIQLNTTGGVKVDFSEEFLTSDSSRNVLETYAVVKTLCSTGMVSTVEVTADGNPITDRDGNEIGFISASDINLETEEYSSEMKKVTLYFASHDGKKLDSEERTIKITDLQPIEECIINELIKGSQLNSKFNLLSKKTVLISVNIEDNICYLNFKSGFIKENAGNKDKERLIIYSIVDSLTEMETINRVQFYIDGKRVEKFGSFSIKDCISRNDDIINKTEK